MPDIAMCKGGDCPMKEGCYRYKATPSEFRQPYFGLPPFYKTPDEMEYRCDHFLPLSKKGVVDALGDP